MANKKKAVTTATAVVATAALLLGGTFAWQSISQTALNEKEATINPGGRLHDDFNGTNKDVYVENFAENDIYARVRLEEYFEITMNKGVDGAEKTEQIIGEKDDNGEYTYEIHKFGTDKTKSAEYWNWKTGGSTVYMPTFNKNKDSLVADINGTFENNYEDYVGYEDGDITGSTEIYDSDSNSADEVGTDFDNLDEYVSAGNIKTVTESHTAKETETAKFISMDEWLALNDGTYSEETHSNYWVYDEDGWCYWSSPIKKETATGLLLDEISLIGVMDDSYYYAINVVGQFITADDLGKDDNTGFYADGETVSDDALKLLKKIGVEVGDGEDTEPVTTFTTTDDLSATPYALFTVSDSTLSDGNTAYDMTFVRTKDSLTENSEKCLWSGKQLVKVYSLDEENTYFTSTLTDEPWYEDFATSTVTVTVHNTLQPKYMDDWFAGFVACTSFELAKIDTSETVGMKALFWNCSSVTQLDCSSFDTSKVIDMGYMFWLCKSLEEIKGIEDFDVSSVQDMSAVFGFCAKITLLDLSGWDVSSATTMRTMFYDDSELCSINAEEWKTSNVEDMSSMFGACPKLTLDCSKWEVAKVTNHDSFVYYGDGITVPEWSE